MSSIYSIPTWTEENRSLHDAICKARVSKFSADSLRQLLQMNKEKFVHLLDNEPKNSGHRANLHSSTFMMYSNYYILKKKIHINNLY